MKHAMYSHNSARPWVSPPARGRGLKLQQRGMARGKNRGSPPARGRGLKQGRARAYQSMTGGVAPRTGARIETPV